jgi:hypothetical protein
MFFPCAYISSGASGIIALLAVAHS